MGLLLRDIKLYLGNRIISVCREITKIYDEVFLGDIESSLEYFGGKKIKGEITLIISKEGYRL